MTTEIKTLRLVFPQWQGGDFAGYEIGSQVLSTLLPEAAHMRTVEIPVAAAPAEVAGLVGSPAAQQTSSFSAIRSQLRAAVDALDKERPDRILTIGGDCAVSVAPFAWLASRYPHLGVVWLDAHPDMWEAEHQPHANARAASILSGNDATPLSHELPATVPLQQFVWVGARAELGDELVHLDTVWTNRVRVADVEDDPVRVVRRLQRKGIRQIAIHFDLDVLDATNFHGVAIGEEAGMSWTGVAALFATLGQEFDIVGITIAEHIPEGMQELRQIIMNTPLYGN